MIARKWRPQTFEEVTGQEVVTQTLRNAIEFDRIHHAYLFSGARGVGKTTTARILAKALNCHKSDKPTVTPCKSDDPHICPSCQEIAESRSIDVLEIDAASHTGIDDVRETIIESINFNPARDRYKVFIIDEVHQLSKPAFNALLKTLEEPPSNVVFVMATTELHKVPVTILSRCQEFQFRTIPLQKIFDRLKLIAKAEKIDVEDDALRELARSGEGSMRDAQSNFDQVISFSAAKVTAKDVTGALGFAGSDSLEKVLSSITERSPLAALAVVDDLISRGHDLRNFCRDLLGLFRDLLVFKVAGTESTLFETAVFSPDQMKAMAANFTEADLLRFFNSLAETETSLREAAHPRYTLEMGLVKLIEMGSVTPLESIIERLNAISPSESMTTPAAKAATADSAPPEKKTLEYELPVSGTQRADSPHATGARATTSASGVASERQPSLSSTPASLAPPVTEPIEDAIPEPPDDDIGFSEREVIEAAMPVIAELRAVAPKWEPPSVSAGSLPDEYREHVEESKLDSWYEQKLMWSGDSLMPMPALREMFEKLFGTQQRTTVASATVNSTSSAAAAAPARSVEEEKVDLPDLGPEATEEELLAYAASHPAVRAAVKVFRGKIIDVRRG